MRDGFRGNPETQFFRNRETSGIEEFDTKVIAKYRNRRPNEDSFIGPKGYSREEVENDLADIRAKEEGAFTKEGESATQMFYGSMEGILNHGWLGESNENRTIEVIQTSRYDDVKNGVDFTVVIHEKGQPPIVIGIDATSNEDPYKLEQKLLRSINDVKHGKLAALKYYRYKGEAAPKGYAVPRAVLGANAENAKRIAESMIGTNAKENPVQHIFLQELEGQFRTQLEVAIDAYRRHGESTDAEPEILRKLESWSEKLPDIVEERGLNTEEVQAFNELLQEIRTTFAEGTNVYGKNLKRLSEIVGYVARVRMEKSASVAQDAFKDDRTVQTLTHSRRAA